MVELLTCNQWVIGSSPIVGSLLYSSMVERPTLAGKVSGSSPDGVTVRMSRLALEIDCDSI